MSCRCDAASIKWLIVLGGFLSYFLADGCTYSVGIWFAEFRDVYQYNSASTSILAALIYAMPQFLSPFLCPLTDVVGYSTAAAWGGTFLCFSFIATSLVRSMELTFLSVGLLTAIGLQLTYTSAFMAVISTFKDHKYFALACGLMVSGGGIGAFATNHLLAWILSIWTLREALIIQGAILLHVWCSAALFYWVDETAIEKRILLNTNSGDYLSSPTAILHSNSDFSPVPGYKDVSASDSSENDDFVVSELAAKSSSCQFSQIIKRCWFLCPILMILAPASQRPRAQKTLPATETSSELTCASKCSSFCEKLAENFKQLRSRHVWRNGDFLIFILSNGIAAAGVVIPWTFAFDYIQQLWFSGYAGEVDAQVDAQIAWFPSLIGLGSCFGQIVFGLAASKLHNKSSDCAELSIMSGDFQTSHPAKIRHRRMNNLGAIFAFACLLNFATTTVFTFTPIESAIAVAGLTGNSPGQQSVFSTNSGRFLAFVCFAVGSSDGAFMTLLGLLLEDSLPSEQFPAGLGISLCITGVFNFAGTVIGGHLFDLFGSYAPSLLLASVLPLAAAIAFISYHCIAGRSRAPSMPTPQCAPTSVCDF